MNYIDELAARIGARCELNIGEPEQAKLLRMYALLALTTGPDTTLEHVHDAWAAWRVESVPNHGSAVPFRELPLDTQELDEPYRQAIVAEAPRNAAGDTIKKAHLFVGAEMLLLRKAQASTEALFLGLERRLFERAASTFQARARRAITAATHPLILGTGDRPATEADVRNIEAALKLRFKGWDDDMRPLMSAVVRQSYMEGKRQMLQRAYGLVPPLNPKAREWPALVQKAPDAKMEPDFELVDERAVDQLIEGQLHWIGQNYEDNLSEGIDEMVRETMLQSGLGRSEAGKLLRDKLARELGITTEDLPKGWMGRSGQYFEGIAANAVTNGRVQGSLGQMRSLGVTRYAIAAVGDERTCSRCLFMDGRTFEMTVADGIINRLRAAKTPEDVKAAHPWARTLQHMKDDPERYAFPPFHFICRCTVDIAEDAEIPGL